MKKLIIGLVTLCMANAVTAQDKGYTQEMSTANQPGIFNHLDIGVTAGTMGIGADLTMPIGKSVRIRAGYTYMPAFKIRSDFPIETSDGTKFEDIKEKLGDDLYERLNKKLNDVTPVNPGYRELCDQIRDLDIHGDVRMNMQPNMHQFKLMVDVMPFRNKHWSFTAGIFAGASMIGKAYNQKREEALLRCVNLYNELYIDHCQNGFQTIDEHGNISSNYISEFNRGVLGFPLGTFKNGDRAVMIPGKNNSVHAEMEVGKIHPYMGGSYNTHLSRNHKWNMTVDAGIMIMCGKPKVTVDNVYRISKDFKQADPDNYSFDIVHPNDDWSDFVVEEPLNGVNIMEDVKNIPGKVGDLVDFASKVKVYPNLSVTFSYRLF